MPEYLAPGVYVEETSFRSKSIEGVSTTTTGFIGPARYGPLDVEPEIITSVVEFERIYGGRDLLEFSGGSNTQTNFLWQAVRAYFEEGGKRLYVSRTYTPAVAATPSDPHPGHATGRFPTSSPVVQIRARFPGRAGDARVTFALKLSQNILVRNDANTANVVKSLSDRDIVLVRDGDSTPTSPLTGDTFCIALRNEAQPADWQFSTSGYGLGGSNLHLEDLNPAAGHEIRIVTVTVAVEPMSGDGLPYIEADLPLDPTHLRAGSPDSVFDRFHETQASAARARSVPIVLSFTGSVTGLTVLQALINTYTIASPPLSPPDQGLQANLTNPDSEPARRLVVVPLQGGNDGVRPDAAAYEGEVDAVTGNRTGLTQFEDIEDISIVAAPGSTFGYEDPAYGPQARGIVNLLISHAQRMRYRIAILDSGDDQSISEVRAMRGRIDSTYAALYYPWVRVIDPLTRREINLPPSGFVAGIYARNDINRAVYKAPANEVVNLAVGFEKLLNKAQQDVLNPEGINCFRFFEGRGFRLWGARTISSDPEWKYVNLRRYFAYLERSIDKGTQWAVFEPNGEALWANVRRTIEDFLLNEWQSGALLGDKPDKAFFVKCDRSTMSQNDLDNGRLICLIGVAPLRPAEFVIFRIGQWTSDRKV